MADFLSKVPIRIPVPGTLPGHLGPGGPKIPPGVPPLEDDPTQRIKEAIRDAQRAALTEKDEPPPYTPNPMRNIEYDLPHHPGFFERENRAQYDEMHVELVLDGACDILTRAIGDRAAYDQFRDRYYERTLELNYLQSQLDLDEMEFKSGAWDRPTQQAEADLATASARKLCSELRRDKRDQELKTTAFNAKHQASLIARAVRAGMSGVYKPPAATPLANVGANGEPDGAAGPAHEMVHAANLESASDSLTRELLGYTLEKEGEEQWHAAMDRQVQLVTTSVDLEKQLRDLRKKRFSALQAYLAERVDALNGADGPHNALVQMKAIQDRFSRDMVDLFDRLTAIAMGLDLIYGLKLPPATPEECAKKNHSFLDLSVAWVRNVVRYLNARATKDRTLTLSYSLRQLVGEAEFQLAIEAGRADGKPIKMNFTVPYPTDRVLRFPRLRGMSCYSVYGADTPYVGVFSLYMTPPPYAYMAIEKALVPFLEPAVWPNPKLPKQLGNSVGGNDARPWDDTPILMRWGNKTVRVQKNRTPAFVSRVAARFPLRAPEICATDSLFNISPFDAPNPEGAGATQWQIVIDSKTTIGIDVASVLKDLEVDFYLLASPEIL